jgi:CheY-like chemotaxis protein
MSELTRILYAEDEPDILEVALIALEAVGGFTVRACSSGQQLLDNAIAFSPELILLDVMMPNMDGPTTLAQLRQVPELSAVPVAFMTAKVQPQEVVHLVSLGAIAVIPKPFDPMTLADQIKEVWTAWHARQV